jgi:hypothetical protein
MALKAQMTGFDRMRASIAGKPARAHQGALSGAVAAAGILKQEAVRAAADVAPELSASAEAARIEHTVDTAELTQVALVMAEDPVRVDLAPGGVLDYAAAGVGVQMKQAFDEGVREALEKES